MVIRGLISTILAITLAACGGSDLEPASPASSATIPMASEGSEAVATPRISAPAASPDPRAPDLAGMFDVGGHSLYLECRGTSGPVVLFDAGSGSDSTSWHRSPKDFIGLVDHSYRRCLYDRANLGQSDRIAGSRTSATAAEELHLLLDAADLPPPYVLVGRSFGGFNVRLFADAYPSDVQAMILIETLTPEFLTGLESLLRPAQWAQEAKSFDTIEPPLDELASAPLVEAATMPDVPLLVVAGTKWHSGNEPWPDDWPGPELDVLWAELQADLAASVPRGELIVFEGGDHSLQVSQPERLAEEINVFLARH